MAEFGLIEPPAPGPPPDWRRIDEVILANTSLKPTDLLTLTVPEVCFLVTSICKKDGEGSGSDDPVAVQNRLNAVLAEAQLYHKLTLEQRLEIARRELEG